MRRLAAILLFATLCQGCLVRTSGGYVQGISGGEGQSGMALNVFAGMGDKKSGRTVDFASGLAVRSKLSEESSMVALGSGFDFQFTPLQSRFRPFINAGIHLLQFEESRGGFGFGMFSPYLDAGLGIGFARMWSLTLGAGIGYDIRFNSNPNTFYFSTHAGLCFGMCYSDR